MKADLKALVAVLVVCALGGVWMARSNPPQSASRLGLPEANFTIVLTELSSRSPVEIQRLAEEIELQTGTKPKIDNRRSLALEQCHNRDRRQWDADRILPLVPVPPDSLVIAVFGDSLYTGQIPQWRYCFGVRGERAAVLSPYNMGTDSTAPAVVQERFTKLTLRYILEMGYDLQRRDDPTSLLHRSVMGPADLDRMEFKI